MTLKEKLAILIETSPANDRLEIPKYNHGNEALHGVVRPGTFTVYPQAIALGATFDDDLIEEIADAISDESRAIHHHGRGVCLTKEEYDARYSGLLTFWSPDLNICRDPRWGRTGETYGEDPYLAGKIGAAFVRGLQGKDPHYLKAVATPKHYTANNEEHNRFSCDAKMSEQSLREYHLEPFRRAIEEGIDPVTAIQMVTINVAQCFQLDHEMGSVAPSKCADLVLIDDLNACHVTDVFINGDRVAKDGKLTVEIAPYAGETVAIEKEVDVNGEKVTLALKKA